MSGHSSWWLVGWMLVPTLAQAQNNSANSHSGPCGAANGGGQNSTNYYATGDPCAHVYTVPAERVRQLMTANPSCSLYSRTQVVCSKPVNGNYGQVEVDRSAGSGGPRNPSPRQESSSGTTAASGFWGARYPNPGQKARIDQATLAIQRNPRDADAYVQRALAYMEPTPGGGKPPLPNMDLAIPDLEQALKLNPRSFTARHDYAHAAYLLGFQDFAIAEFGMAIELNPSSARSFLGRGWASYEACRLDNATADFARAVRLDPSLQAKLPSQQYMGAKKNECTALSYAAAHPPPPPRRGMEDSYLGYQRQEANRRANEASARGDNEAARSNREGVH